VTEAVGAWRPPRIGRLDVPGPDPELVERLRGVTGLSAAFSDELDRAGLRAAVPASVLNPLRPGDVVVGRVLTLRYLPARTIGGPSRLAHLTACEEAQPGDVLAIAAPRDLAASVLGGLAAAAIRQAGVAAVIVDGAVRDLDEVADSGLSVWSRSHTPITGRGRLDAAEINGRLEVGGVAVEPGDVAVADRSGIAFVPADHFVELARRVLRT
jgi:4-hydroxy-4-methyl-2-oxoglutarate aldolase